MNTKKSKQEQEKEMAAYYQAHKDEGEWEAVRATRPAKAGMVYSFRFTESELSSLRAIAEQDGRRISDLLHDALTMYIAAKTEKKPDYDVIKDWNTRRFVLFSGPRPAMTASGNLACVVKIDEPETAII